MYPRGSNGAAQAAIDARTLADFLRSSVDPRDALTCLRGARGGPAARVVRTNREHPPDFINIKVEELVGDQPFDDLDKYITQDELRALSENYKRIAGFALADVSRPGRLRRPGSLPSDRVDPPPFRGQGTLRSLPWRLLKAQ